MQKLGTGEAAAALVLVAETIINSRISLAVSKLLPCDCITADAFSHQKVGKLVNKREGASSLDVKEETYRFDVTPVDDGKVRDAVNSVQR